MKLLLDMNLSPTWVSVLNAAGHEAVHWSDVGEAGASDKLILTWAKARKYVVLSHDLDFGAILAATAADAPSVLQLRFADLSPEHATRLVLDVLKTFAPHLHDGALVSVDEARSRVRVLPLIRE